ncbi:MAG: rhomboid family intramembrane serine protease [Flavobacteriia bacterium]|nr:rhomboid family intramembrane serine protease [Flavobacteriia bacterium]
MFSFLNNIPQVTKNILLLNVMLYIVSNLLFQFGTIDLFNTLSQYNILSPKFQPYQLVTNMFMHSRVDIFHIILNMYVLVLFGSFLERLWGPKKFFIFYILCGIGASVLDQIIGFNEITNLKHHLAVNGIDILDINNRSFDPNLNFFSTENMNLIKSYNSAIDSSSLGASGAIFGVLAGFALLFPNTELVLLFPPIPIKAKFLIGGYILFELYKSFKIDINDNVNHLAHIGGAITGIIIILIWRKTDRKNFW